MPNQKPTANDWGNIISVDAQIKAPRGATKVFEDGLLLLLAGTDLICVHPVWAYPQERVQQRTARV